jgi:hypothetical protein
MSEVLRPKLVEVRKKRPVLIVVEKWPDGTMAMKFGYVLMSALSARRDERTLMQFGPERIFKVETDVSEAEFRLALQKSDVSYHRHILFSELPAVIC